MVRFYASDKKGWEVSYRVLIVKRKFDLEQSNEESSVFSLYSMLGCLVEEVLPRVIVSDFSYLMDKIKLVYTEVSLHGELVGFGTPLVELGVVAISHVSLKL